MRIGAVQRYAKIVLRPLKQAQVLPPLKKESYKGSGLMNYILQTMQKYPDAVVMTQIGGFYELYFEHALEYGPKLALKVAKKRQFNPVTRQESIPMTGFPSSQVAKYSQMLVQNWGKNVVVLSQSMENILLKAPEHLKRPIERILTPGTLIEQDCVDLSQHNYIATVNFSESSQEDQQAQVALAWVDMNEGSIFYEIGTRQNLSDILSRLMPREIVLNSLKKQVLPDGYYTTYTAFPPREMFVNYRAMYDQSHESALMMADSMGTLAQGAVAALLAFLQEAYPNSRFKYQPPRQFENDNHMIIDASSRDALELFKAQQRDSLAGSVCSIVDNTYTTSGSRLLKDWLSRPLQRLPRIEHRLDLVAALVQDPLLLSSIQDDLRECLDVKSITQKLGLAPQADTIHLWIKSIILIKSVYAKIPASKLFEEWRVGLEESLGRIGPILESAQRTIKTVQSDPNLTRFIPRRFDLLVNPGVSKQMDTLLAQREKLVLAYDGIALKLPGEPRYSPYQGYYFYLKSDALVSPPAHHRVVASTRISLSYTTETLSKWATEYEQNTSKLELIQTSLIERMRDELLSVAIPVRAAAGIVDELDVIQSFATLAVKHNLVRPEFGSGYDVQNGWSLVVEQGLASDNKKFTRNDCHLGNKQRVCMLSGPNMGGKSTYLRQVALISVLAQAGCFVPAERAVVPILDRVFCRMGSGDDVTRGRSTFMVEMLETALILRQATAQSLAILDEVGRGTSERDGVAIAFATIKHMIGYNKCLAIFSTHYSQEISSALAQSGLSDAVQFLRTSPKLLPNHIEYNYNLEKGINEAAHGIEMAKLAGFPKRSLAKAIKAYAADCI